MIIDDFIESFDDLKAASIANHFEAVVNDIDGVVYPLICRDIPKSVQLHIVSELALILGRPAKDLTMFMRRSPLGVDCPNQVHSDISMGEYSLMLYINDERGGGTSFLKHRETGISFNPHGQDFVDIVVRDGNSPDKWDVVDLIQMKPNRALIFRSDMLHRAEPVGGFGEGKEARVILTCFFS